MNNQQKGANRDLLVVKTLTDWGVMDSQQICLLLFPSYRVAQRRLSKLVNAKRIKRCTQTVPYSYYITAQQDIVRRINENWIRLYIEKSLKTWQRIVKYDYRTYIVLNTATGEQKEYCLFDMDFDVDKIKEGLTCAK